MNLSRLSGDLKSISNEQRDALLSIIQQKTDDDMKEVIQKIEQGNTLLNSKIDSMGDSLWGQKFEVWE